MLAVFRNRTLSVHAARSMPVLCRAPAVFRHARKMTVLKQQQQAISASLVSKAAAEDAAVAEQPAGACSQGLLLICC
jgi:hypothetical protein